MQPLLEKLREKLEAQVSVGCILEQLALGSQ
jgi:hypothetical protein